MKQKIIVTIEAEQLAIVCDSCGVGDSSPITKTVKSLNEATEAVATAMQQGRMPSGWHHTRRYLGEDCTETIFCVKCIEKAIAGIPRPKKEVDS